MNSIEETQRIVSISQRWLLEYRRFAEHFEQIRKGYYYLAGEQYTKEELLWYEKVRRPARVFNLIFPLFNQILGDMLLNDQKIRVYPLPGGTAEMAQVFEDLIDHANMQNDARSVLMKYALAGIVKQGFIFPRFSAERELDGSLVFSDVDEFEIIYDSAAQDYFLDDAEYIARSRWMSKKQLIWAFPHKRREFEQSLIDREQQNFYARDDISEKYSYIYDDINLINIREGKYRVIEWHEKKFEEVEIVVMPDGQTAIWTLEGKKADLFRRLHPEARFIRRYDEVKTITTIIPALNIFIEEKRADIQDRTFDFIPFSAYNYGKRAMENFGIFKNSVGPQDDFNEWQNQQNALIRKAIDPGKTYKPVALENPQDVEGYGSGPGVNYKVKPEYDIDKVIRDNEIPKLPFAPAQLSEARGELLQRIIGVTPNMMGVNDTKTENASLFAQRVQRGQVALQVIFNNFNRSKRRLYNKIIRIMQENYTTEKFFLITAKMKDSIEQRNLVQLYGANILNDIRVGRYEVMADDMQQNPTARHLRFLQKGEVVQTVLAMFSGVPLPAQAISLILNWWLDESDLGDVDKFIAAFTQVIQAQEAEQADAAMRQQATQQVASILQLANMKQNMEKPELPAERAPASNYK